MPFLSVHVRTLLEFLELPSAVSQELKGFCPPDSLYQNPFATLEGVYRVSGSRRNAFCTIDDAARLRGFCAEVPIGSYRPVVNLVVRTFGDFCHFRPCYDLS